MLITKGGHLLRLPQILLLVSAHNGIAEFHIKAGLYCLYKIPIPKLIHKLAKENLIIPRLGKFTFPSEASLAESPTCLLWFLGQTKDGVDSFILVVYGVVAVLGEIEVIRSPPLFLSPALDES